LPITTTNLFKFQIMYLRREPLPSSSFDDYLPSTSSPLCRTILFDQHIFWTSLRQSNLRIKLISFYLNLRSNFFDHIYYGCRKYRPTNCSPKMSFSLVSSNRKRKSTFLNFIENVFFGRNKQEHQY